MEVCTYIGEKWHCKITSCTSIKNRSWPYMENNMIIVMIQLTLSPEFGRFYFNVLSNYGISPYRLQTKDGLIHNAFAQCYFHWANRLRSTCHPRLNKRYGKIMLELLLKSCLMYMYPWIPLKALQYYIIISCIQGLGTTRQIVISCSLSRSTRITVQ